LAQKSISVATSVSYFVNHPNAELVNLVDSLVNHIEGWKTRQHAPIVNEVRGIRTVPTSNSIDTSEL
jgi:hypothetical protein